MAVPDLYPLISSGLRLFPAETARDLTVRALAAGLGNFLTGREAQQPDPPILSQRLWNLDFPNPVGLAAGYDKDARVPNAMLGLGFGFVEIGTVTPRPQTGNPKPRVFRLDEDRAIVNRMGFNSGGLEMVIERLARRPRSGVIGLNLGKNRDSSDAAADYELGIRRGARFADYLVINISSPNTPGLRDLQHRASLEALLRPLLRAREEAAPRVPLLVKIAPDLTKEERQEIASVALESRVDGLIVSNTTVDRPVGLVSRHARQAGGLSGRPLFAASTELLADMYRLTGGRLPLVGVGGIYSGSEAYTKVRAGASLVQLYTGLVFGGPRLIGRIKHELADLLRQDGFASVAEAVGTGLQSLPAAPPGENAARMLS
jgi:dihydroorotate dehydrogenase